MSNKVERYTWCDQLIKAESLGLLSPGAVNLALRLATAIYWNPADGRPSGLYWKNEEAVRSVNSSTRTFRRVRKELVAAGFFIMKGRNLLPTVPDLSQVESVRGANPANVAPLNPANLAAHPCQTGTPYSADIFTVDNSVKEQPLVADAPNGRTLEVSKLEEEPGIENLEPSLTLEPSTALPNMKTGNSQGCQSGRVTESKALGYYARNAQRLIDKERERKALEALEDGW